VKKQVVVMVSIALVFFLAGALFSMGSTALDIIPNPFVNHLDTSKLQVKVVKFEQPNEINVTERFPKFFNLTTFIWTPNNPQNNIILAVYVFCEYRSESPSELTLGLEVNGLQLGELTVNEPSANWKFVSFLAQPHGLWINPNQNNYTLGFDAGTYNYASYWIPKYVKNITVIIEAIDG